MSVTVTFNSTYEFDTDQNGFPTFTEKNMQLLKSILRYDSNYSTASDKTSPEYLASYAGIFEKDEFFNFASTASATERDKLGNPTDDLYRAIVSLDNLNHTHLASEGIVKSANQGREKVAAKIRKLGGKKLKERLESGDAELVHDIANAKVGGKHNFSFATKFCAYASLHALKMDNYCIYDEILQSVLPYYAHTYIKDCANIYPSLYKTEGGKNKSLVYKYKENDDYDGYRKFIDKVIEGVKEEIGETITYEDFDHLLWYYFKGAKSRILNAMSLLPENKVPRQRKKKTQP